MRHLGRILLVTTLLASVGDAALGQSKPVQLALFAPVQIFPAQTSIGGIRLSLIYGKNARVSGLDLGLVNHTTSGISEGVQTGLVGVNDADFQGLQWNFVNVNRGNVEGVQWGFYNHAKYANGLQLGFINHAASLKGIQIGLVNIIETGGQFPVFPIVNWSF
jgi:hypothetical protein